MTKIDRGVILSLIERFSSDIDVGEGLFFAYIDKGIVVHFSSKLNLPDESAFIYTILDTIGKKCHKTLQKIDDKNPESRSFEMEK